MEIIKNSPSNINRKLAERIIVPGVIFCYNIKIF